ncbi:hypothetical protein BKA57DRAFT_501348 [Linnemannia elongata]|nr:hypothetical protein BKA57DRAFT_501348 [Linnemannia elongata]
MDEMAAHNMVNVVQGHLLHQQRPLYLQTVDENGRYLWMAMVMTGDSGNSKDTVITGDTEDKDDQTLKGTSITAGNINDCILDSVPARRMIPSFRRASSAPGPLSHGNLPIVGTTCLTTRKATNPNSGTQDR